ncbi:hypothetical protein [Sediminitomix flava]|uniref:Uncharacterized protein n=1 Tax=Sediminitomix flava TaxID=379075 RepID=A0A315Z8Q1_SEDFL|nr:hypothetical protein [Sediminitomix flava]PWJ41956.1 hypothetical protein BC781_103206 [Sediminitomix flava]
MHKRAIPKQPPKVISYLRVGLLLHTSLILFFIESWVYWIQLEKAYSMGSVFWTIFWIAFFLFSFLHIFLVLADSWSRFQNYKRIKDQLYKYGFQSRIINRFIGSKCQRAAAHTAALELGMESQIKHHFWKMGYRWFHFIPDFMVKDPLFFFRRYFWSRTFLEKFYTSEFDYHQLYADNHSND